MYRLLASNIIFYSGAAAFGTLLCLGQRKLVKWIIAWENANEVPLYKMGKKTKGQPFSTGKK